MSQTIPPIRTLVVARAGIMRDSLHSLLRALPNIAVVAVTDDLLAADKALAARGVDFLVLDAGLSEERVIALAQRVAGLPALILCVVLVSTRAQGQRCLMQVTCQVSMQDAVDGETLERWLENLARRQGHHPGLRPADRARDSQ